MAVKIRLSRIGKKHAPFFRLVAVDSRVKRDGKILDNIGTYDTLKGQVIQFHEDLYTSWISKGALPTDSAERIYLAFKKHGIYQAPAKQVFERPARVADHEDTVAETVAE